MKQIWYMLEHDCTQMSPEVRINYEGFCQVAGKCRELFGAACESVFQPSVFLSFERDENGTIAVPLYMNYVTLHTQMQQAHAQLSSFDSDADGMLSDTEAQEFVMSVVSGLPCMEDMPASFVPHYRHIAVRKLLFFHGRCGARGGPVQLPVRDLLVSAELAELYDLRNYLASDEPQLQANWFSLQSTRRVHNIFTLWDEDCSSSLSLAEFSNISQGSMTPLFLQRVFQEHVRRRGGPGARRGSRTAPPLGPCSAAAGGPAGPRDEMDLDAFVDFVLAWDNHSRPAAIRYFFSVLDLDKKGYLSPSNLYVFFKEVHKLWLECGYDPELSITDVVDELIDMVQPAAPPAITLSDMLRCGMAGNVITMLANVEQFFNYNYRENLMSNEPEQ